MTYVFDMGPLKRMIDVYYPEVFKGLWANFDEMLNDGRIVSTREVLREIEAKDDALTKWACANKSVFHTPADDELQSVADIFAIPHFQVLLKRQAILNGRPVADPFVIAKARTYSEGCVVTTEIYKVNAAKVPNVCKHFSVSCKSFHEFMIAEGWSF